jgi:hypothetical protein
MGVCALANLARVVAEGRAHVAGRLEMREEALLHPTAAPAMLPKWTELWWGED